MFSSSKPQYQVRWACHLMLDALNDVSTIEQLLEANPDVNRLIVQLSPTFDYQDLGKLESLVIRELDIRLAKLDTRYDAFYRAVLSLLEQNPSIRLFATNCRQAMPVALKEKIQAMSAANGMIHSLPRCVSEVVNLDGIIDIKLACHVRYAPGFDFSMLMEGMKRNPSVTQLIVTVPMMSNNDNNHWLRSLAQLPVREIDIYYQDARKVHGGVMYQVLAEVFTDHFKVEKFVTNIPDEFGFYAQLNLLFSRNKFIRMATPVERVWMTDQSSELLARHFLDHRVIKLCGVKESINQFAIATLLSSASPVPLPIRQAVLEYFILTRQYMFPDFVAELKKKCRDFRRRHKTSERTRANGFHQNASDHEPSSSASELRIPS